MDAFDILLTLSGRDEASQVFQQVSNNAQSSLGAIERNADQTTASISQKFSEIGASIQQGLSNVDMAMMNLNSANHSIMGSLGATKSAMDYVYGTTSTADTNKVLMKNWQDETATYEELYDTVDKITDKSLTSMQDLIPAMNAFKASTQATGKVMKDNVAEGMAQFGAYVLSLTGSQQLAKTAMTDLSKGLVGRGAFSALDQYGVTKETLMARGWSGENEDIEGYMNAVREVAGVVDELMDTSQGVEAEMGKMWSRAGKRIGNEMLPGVVNLKKAFMDLDKKLDGDLSTSVLRISLLLEETSQKAHTLNTMFMGLQNVTKILRGVAQWYGLIDTETKNSVQMKQAENQEIAMNNELLATNTDLRLANAEAMGFQGTMGQGVSYEGGEYTGGGEEGNWSTDVLANTAGGMLESKYDRMRYGDSDDKKFEEEYKEYKQKQQSTKQRVGGGYVGNVDFNSGELEKGTREYVENQKNLKRELRGILKAEDNLDDILPSTGMFGASFQNDINHHKKRIMDELDDLDGVYDGPFTKLKNFLNEKKKRKLPEADLSKGFDGFANSITKLGDKLTTKVSRPFARLKNKYDVMSIQLSALQGDTKTETMDKVWGKLKRSFGNLRGAKEVEKGAENVAKSTGDVVRKTGDIANAGKGAGAIGAGMGEASAGFNLLGLGGMGLAEALTTLLVPLLAISAVIAIMIPIVAGLAIEAMYFIMLVGQVMSAMDWSSIDVDSAVEGLKSMAIALGYLSLAMLSLSVTGLVTGLAFILTGFGNVEVVLGQAVTMLKKASVELNQLGSVTVNDNVASNLQNIGTALNGVSMAMMSLSGVTVANLIGQILTLGGQFGSLSSNLDKAKTDIQHAITVINSMDFAGIDESKIGMINNTLQAIGAFGEAFKGLSDIRTTQVVGDFTSWLLGGGIFGVPGATIQEAFNKAHDDIKNAVSALKGYGDIDEVPEGIGEKLKNVAEAISSVAEIIKALKEVKDDKGFLGALDGFFNGSNDNLVVGLQKALVTIRAVATRINSLKTISNIDELVPKKLQAISDAIKAISDVMNGFSSIKSFKDDGSIQTMPQTIQKVAHNLRLVSGYLAGLKTIYNIDPMVATKVEAIATTLDVVNKAVGQISAVNNATGGWNFENLGQRLEGVKNTISTTASHLNDLGKAFGDGGHDVPEGLTAQIDRVTNTMSSVKKFATGMTTFPVVDGPTIGYKVARAVTGFKRASSALKKITQEDNVGDIGAIISKVSSAVSQLKTALQGMDFGSTGVNIGLSLSRGVTQGLSSLSPRVTGAVGIASRAGASRGWTGGAYIAQSMKGGFQDALHLSDVMSAEMEHVKTAVENGIESAKTVAQNGAQEIVEAFKNGIEVGSPGAIARTMSAEMKYMKGFILDGGVENVKAIGDVATGLVRNFNPETGLNMSRINSLRSMNSTNQYQSTQRPVSIVIGEGAIQLDARNLTTSESRQIMINAIEGLDVIQSVNIRNMG